MPNSNIQRRNRVVERHLELAQRLARNFSQRTGLEQDDLFQVAVLGLIKRPRPIEAKRMCPLRHSPGPMSVGRFFITCGTASPWCDYRDGWRRKRND